MNAGFDETCVICGRDALECICPECITCDGLQGDLRCYEAGHLELSPEQVEGMDKRREWIRQETAYYDELARRYGEPWDDEGNPLGRNL